MAMPRTIRDRCYRTEEVDLQPGGATIAVEVPSDNPFELNGDVTIVTQASGGVTAPDPRQRSKKLLNKQHNSSHINRGFMPGMGDGDQVEMGPQGMVRRAGGRSGKIIRANKFEITAGPPSDFMPGMGDVDGFHVGKAIGSAFKDAVHGVTNIVSKGVTLNSAAIMKAAKLGVRLSPVEVLDPSAANRVNQLLDQAQEQVNRTGRAYVGLYDKLAALGVKAATPVYMKAGAASGVFQRRGVMGFDGFGDNNIPPMIARPDDTAAPASDFLTKIFSGAKDLAPTLLQARQQNISAAQAQTDQIKAQTALQQANTDRIKAGMPPLSAEEFKSKGMSTGTKAGIAIGVVAVAGLLAYLAFKK